MLAVLAKTYYPFLDLVYMIARPPEDRTVMTRTVS